MRALVTGATGFVGRALCATLGDVTALARDPAAALRVRGVRAAIAWDASRGVPAEALDGVEAVFHLAGEPIAEGRLGPDHRRRILQSRIEGTRHLVEALARARARPRALVAASASGFYGSRGDEELDEAAPRGEGFIAEVCEAWERAAAVAAELGVRVVSLRLGIVLGPGGGALARMLTPFRLGLGGRLASGRQWMSWIQLEDVVGLAAHAVAHPTLSGPVNAVAPAPVRNAEFTRALAAALRRPALLPVPAAALRLAFGDLADVLLASQRMVPAAALASGYRFRQGELPAALRASLAVAR
jgi:uncharacterized protein (TIGR01777 family)